MSTNILSAIFTSMKTIKLNGIAYRCTLLLSLTLIYLNGNSQTNILSTNSAAKNVLIGNYNPVNYMATNVLNHPDSIVQGIQASLNADSVKSYLLKLSSFQNRNTGSDTVSNTRGIGAARRWAYSKFQDFSKDAENRLLPSYLQFDNTICNVAQHRNVFAVLPGIDSTDHSIVLIEGHMDSRCQGVCDTSCLAEGAEDNASGTALVLELARVMSRYSYDHTIVFMLTIGEEQGLYGADAFADYCKQENISVKAVFNNDVIGGIICGKTSSAPSCPGLNNIDSTQVRIFSAGSYNSAHKNLARFIKLEYIEELKPIVVVPMMITIMSAEDRTGRGGDHMPFRQKGITAVRFTSANEHGDASNGPGYTDRQHTSGDILGLNTDADPELDTFFVNFNYLLRNAAINGTAAGMAAIGPETPTFTVNNYNGGITVSIADPYNYNHYRIGVRTTKNDFDTIYTLIGTKSDTLYPTNGGMVFITVASVDTNGIESLFSNEDFVAKVGIAPSPSNITSPSGIELLQNRPNPFDEATYIVVNVHSPSYSYNAAHIEIRDLQGKLVKQLPIKLKSGMNEVLYQHGYGQVGTYIYSLIVDGKNMGSKRMIFAN